MSRYNVAITPAPSFRSFVPHSLHSGASGSRTRVNASFHFAHPALGQTSLHFILPLHLPLPTRHKDLGERLMAFEGMALLIPQITYIKVFLSPSYYLNLVFPPGVAVPVTKVNSCFEGEQVQASGFAENLHPPSSDSIFCKKPAHPNTTFFSHQNNNDRADGKTHNIK